jgi:hypothetical protein
VYKKKGKKEESDDEDDKPQVAGSAAGAKPKAKATKTKAEKAVGSATSKKRKLADDDDDENSLPAEAMVKTETTSRYGRVTSRPQRFSRWVKTQKHKTTIHTWNFYSSPAYIGDRFHKPPWGFKFNRTSHFDVVRGSTFKYAKEIRPFFRRLSVAIYTKIRLLLFSLLDLLTNRASTHEPICADAVSSAHHFDNRLLQVVLVAAPPLPIFDRHILETGFIAAPPFSHLRPPYIGDRFHRRSAIFPPLSSATSIFLQPSGKRRKVERVQVYQCRGWHWEYIRQNCRVTS